MCVLRKWKLTTMVSSFVVAPLPQGAGEVRNDERRATGCRDGE